MSLLIFFSILFTPYSLFLYLRQLYKDYKCFEKILFKQSAYLHNDFMNLVKLIRKDIDVNEHESISNTTLRPKLIKEQCFYCRSTFHSHRKVFNKMNVNNHLACSGVVLLTSVHKRYIWSSL